MFWEYKIEQMSPNLQGANSLEEIELNVMVQIDMPKVLWKHREKMPKLTRKLKIKKVEEPNVRL